MTAYLRYREDDHGDEYLAIVQTEDFKLIDDERQVQAGAILLGCIGAACLLISLAVLAMRFWK